MNAERGLGYPLTDVMSPPGSGNVPAATVPLWSYFQRGAVYALPPAAQADGGGFVTHEVHGAIWVKYRNALGAEHGFLGYPITDEKSTQDGTGRFNDFQHGSIYWSTQTNAAYEVHGAIRDEWFSLGGPASFLGYPVSDEMREGDFDGRGNAFQGGPIYWTPQTGAHEMHDETILDKWLDMGGLIPGRSTLGWPTSDVYGSAGSFRQDFQHGYITDINHQATAYCQMQGPGCN